MAHDAATYTPTAVSVETPAATQTRVNAADQAAAVLYAREAVTSRKLYGFLTTGVMGT